MNLFDLAAIFMIVVAAGSWANTRTLRLPREVAMLFVGLMTAAVLWGLQRIDPRLATLTIATNAINSIDFSRTVLGYMLGFLLFAGAMQVDLAEMRRRLFSVSVLATAGVFASILIVGFGLELVAPLFGVSLPLIWAFIFGALISPTDPIAVLATVKRGQLSKKLQVIMQGEALFNDGVGIVAFTTLVALAMGTDAHHSALGVIFSFLIQAAGALALGIIGGLLVLRAMRAIDDFAVEVPLTVALAMGVYAGAQALGLSGPIGVVGAGLLIGSRGARDAMSETTLAYLHNFWTMIDEILNAVLFLLLGLETLILPFHLGQIGVLIACILLVLFARLCVVAPWGVFARIKLKESGVGLTLLWGGLHGALSLAMALSLPPGAERNLILSLTYAVVAFSIIVQGLTFEHLVAALARTPTRP